ncbi:hypothetical protein ATANTOWER_008824 [Ataeniobius toweri]|uniref:Uncharacterized protein n=1 Tax=Ataeniobius toweri TaxID=208326 RepID=A0ABU7AFG3_9TELE|nr:hypothetical protein [Ataeniobius toweri]
MQEITDTKELTSRLHLKSIIPKRNALPFAAIIKIKQDNYTVEDMNRCIFSNYGMGWRCTGLLPCRHSLLCYGRPGCSGGSRSGGCVQGSHCVNVFSAAFQGWSLLMGCALVGRGFMVFVFGGGDLR